LLDADAAVGPLHNVHKVDVAVTHLQKMEYIAIDSDAMRREKLRKF
jgi:hypothetical protein